MGFIVPDIPLIDCCLTFSRLSSQRLALQVVSFSYASETLSLMR